MTDRTVAKRYAKALFDIGTEQGKSEIFAENLNELVALLKENEEVHAMLLNQSIQNGEKKNAMGVIIADMDPMVKNFVNLVIDKNRFDCLIDMGEGYMEYMEAEANILHAVVTSAVELSAEQIEKIEAKFTKLMGQTVKAEPVIDAALIGGVKVRIGDTVYDGSVAHQLKQLSDTLKETVL